MEEWKEYRLGDICQTNKEQYSKKDNFNNVIYLDTGNITENTIRELQYINIGTDKLPSRARRKVNNNDIIFSNVRPIQLHYGILRNPPKNMLVSTGFTVITSNDDLCNAQFLYHFITQKEIVEHLQSIGEQAVSTYPTIKTSDIENLKIYLPSLPTQQKIASILSSLDDKIEVNRRINEQLEELAQALFKSWFVDFEPFKDGDFVESELGMIPKGWKVGTLGELCVINKRSYGAKFENEIAYLDTGSVTRNNIEGYQILNPLTDKIPSRARRAITEGDILYSSVRPNQEHYAFMFNPPSNIVASTGFIAITSNLSSYRYFIYQYLIQEEIIAKLQAIAEQSVSAYPSINAIDITNLKLVIPTRDIVEDFASKNRSFMFEIEKNQQEITYLTALRDTLLPKLMSGELNIDDVSSGLVC